MSTIKLPAAALAYIDGAPDRDAADPLKALDDATLAVLVDTLKAQQKRAHLDVMATVTLRKAIKKAAKKAAYQLKSAGVTSDVDTRKPALKLAPKIDLGSLALVGPPGLSGEPHLLLTGIPGVPSLEMAYDDKRGYLRLYEIDAQTATQLRRHSEHIAHEFGSKLTAMVVPADCAVRLIDVIAAQWDATDGLGGSFAPAMKWRSQAIAAGADASRVAGRAELAAATGAEGDFDAIFHALMDSDASEFVELPRAVRVTINGHVETLTHERRPGDPIEGLSQEAFIKRLNGFLYMTADAWLADEGARAAAIAWLDVSAEILAAMGETVAAGRLLRVSDAFGDLPGLPHESPVIQLLLQSQVDSERAWATYQWSQEQTQRELGHPSEVLEPMPIADEAAGHRHGPDCDHDH